MYDAVGVITRWIVAFLVIFLLCMMLVFTWMKRSVPVRVPSIA